MSDENSYRNILKGTSFFGGVQIFQILITLVRGKFVAMFLGPEGMGVSSLFTTSSNSIQRLSSLGLNLAIVKEVAAHADHPGNLSTTLAVARRMISATSVIGCLICVLFAPFLSRITFGDTSMSWQFMLLGVAVGLSVAFNGKLSMLQGLHEVKRISMASLVGGLTGLLVGVPLYYFYGTKGIVPAMIALALAMYIFYSISLHRAVTTPGIRFSWINHQPIVKRLALLGLLLMTNELLVSLVQYAINVYIKFNGDTSTVGLYQAANSITNQYSGMVFAALAMDYFPRLSKAASDNSVMRDVVNRQTEIVSIVIAPALVLLIITSPLLIRILATSEFLPVTPLMRWMGVGILVRALMVPMGYISFAKGNKKLFFWLEGIFFNLLTLLLSCIGFHFFGLLGLGYALIADNAICLAVYYVINRNLYGYRFSRGVRVYMAYAILAVGAAFGSSLISNTVASYSLMGATAIISVTLSFIIIRRKLTTSS